MIFRAARDDMLAPDLPPLNVERLARMAEAGNFCLAPEPLRRRHRGQAVAKWIAAVAIATAAAWFLSEIAVAALLDEARLAAIGITVP